MAASVFTVQDAKSANIEVIEDGRGTQAVHDVITAMRANRRSGSANTKTRGEVAGSGRKLWRQKGTGRARVGARNNPIWRGGGIVFGPRPRSYAKQVNKGTRRLAFRKALGERIKAEDVLTVSGFSVSDGKTKSFAAEIKGITDADRVLVVSDSFDEKTYLAGRNYQNALLMSAAEVNVEEILYYDKVVVTQDAVETLAKRSSK